MTVEFSVHRHRGSRCELREGKAPQEPSTPEPPLGNIPRVSRLMALAIRFEELIRLGEVVDYADVARLGHVTRARVTQIMNLLMLAPDIQEAILFLPRTVSGRDPITERDIRPIVAELDWNKQRRMWAQFKPLPAESSGGQGPTRRNE
ncbi:MAG: hypothetical protein KAS72_13025 [Phycisphaerales bacterium]|nr:hypothetical protein [Phycisphaerales bacterium]